MSGHSKWSTIKRKKAANDAKKGAAFTRISKDITLAAREGGGDPEMNASLRLAIKAAKAANMPSNNIDRAIKKGTGDLPGMKYEDYVYEGYGPGGVAIMIDVMTDNKNRTVPEIRHLMDKNGGKLGEPGCVNWMFHKKGTILIKNIDCDEEMLLELSLENGAEDFETDKDFYIITVEPDNFEKLLVFLEKQNYKIESSEISLVPENTVKISSKDAEQLLNLLDLLEDNEDIQKVYSNFELTNEN
tara:strand:+ start:585 stop:1316 length:732 start_codon:yes stop_codon:yes gene_type:complete